MNSFSFFLIISILFSTLGFNNTSKKPINIDQILKTEADSLLANNNLYGVSIGIYQNGKTYKLHKGNLIKGETSQPTDQTLYEMASLTKTFAGTLLAQAIVDGKVTIHDDIRLYLDGDYPNLSYEGQPITFAHLVTHNSQLPFLFPHTPDLFQEKDQEKITQRMNDLTRDLTKEDFFEELGNYKLDNLPGSGFAYSNVGANLLGYCLENIYQKPFTRLVKEFITQPLNMKNTFIEFGEKEAHLLAKGYNDKGKEMPFLANKEMQADGGIKSTLPDMLNYMAFHLNEAHPTTKQAHAQLLNGQFGGFENALFWQMFINDKGERKIFQNGGAPGTSSWMTFIPERKIGVFLITNTSGPTVHQQLDKMAHKLLVAISESEF